ncbi:SOS response-associated peptidase [Robiginitomaculum antarcticum]|uniref:SOS response-associated peptidase n=1 Tax=Robiginitomaculum antarcticum TaxID=437507 RepID=UPI00035ED208|nr:SOS response-associated peptidase [Robiginitomaculum antarcticum]
MCGRYALSATLLEIAMALEASDGNNGLWMWKPHYNIAPSMTVPVIALNGQGARVVVPMRWGLHPHWSKAMPEGRPMFNARVETAAEKPSFRTPWKRRRALFPVSGWYEWEAVETEDGKIIKQPFYIYDADKPMTCLAGLWDHYRVDEGITLLSAAILTTAAKGPVKTLHHRMPVMLPETAWADWLDPDADPNKIMQTMRDGENLKFHAVDRAVGNGRAQGADLINPL